MTGLQSYGIAVDREADGAAYTLEVTPLVGEVIECAVYDWRDDGIIAARLGSNAKLFIPVTAIRTIEAHIG